MEPALDPHLAKALERETRAVLERADRLFAPWSCPATAECCQLATTQRPPWLYQAEWGLVREELRRQGRELPAPREDGGCPFLDQGGRRCTVYAARPLGCRTFFCRRVKGPPSQPVAEMNALLERLHAAHLAREADAVPRSLLDWTRGA